MLFFRKKQHTIPTDLFRQIGTDIHSHLLPGIDDGSPDMDTSLQLIRGMQELGYTKLITTPHIISDMYPNTKEIINTKLQEVKNVLKEQQVQVEFRAAAEYFLDDHVASLVKKNDPLLTISEKMVLVEFSMAFPPHGLKDIIFDMQMQGYTPIIAHPERYVYLERTKDFYDELKDAGCLFQLNIMALGPHYGRAVHELAQYLIKKNYYDLVGTDLHHERHLEVLQTAAVTGPLQKLLDSGRIRNASLV